MGVSMEDLVMDLRNDLRALKATLVGIQDKFRRLELYEKSTTVPRPSVLAPAVVDGYPTDRRTLPSASGRRLN